MSYIGSPPRGRGKGMVPPLLLSMPRITPAWAGKRKACVPLMSRDRDHPRMGGEKSSHGLHFNSFLGSPPHGRGKVSDGEIAKGKVRITPAWAGKSMTAPGRSSRTGDHPRVGGEKAENLLPEICLPGSPPRGRGKACTARRRAALHGITPAWAGKRPPIKLAGDVGSGSPPRGRGKMHLSLTLAHDTLHALTQFFNRVAFVDKLQNRSE